MRFLKFGIKVVTARDVVISIVFFGLGLVSSWWTSAYFYEKSLNDSKASAEEAERVNQLILRGIESIGTIQYSRDNSGKIVSVKIELGGNASGNVNATGTLTDAP
ncbi:hypothetical protein [Methylomonas koyamae]|uniref:hypothetical protein n=1 Tax=Methylomonas koyamae TaxID=702114 RepID=UPI0028732E73|nr:hypothetical protein [Methylomonas koyamae]WNB77484.1 hypothetical protein RI210_07860 [Methylomonas koyamae]